MPPNVFDANPIRAAARTAIALLANSVVSTPNAQHLLLLDRSRRIPGNGDARTAAARLLGPCAEGSNGAFVVAPDPVGRSNRLARSIRAMKQLKKITEFGRHHALGGSGAGAGYWSAQLR
jgi:hypothetical protein